MNTRNLARTLIITAAAMLSSLTAASAGRGLTETPASDPRIGYCGRTVTDSSGQDGHRQLGRIVRLVRSQCKDPVHRPVYSPDMLRHKSQLFQRLGRQRIFRKRGLCHQDIRQRHHNRTGGESRERRARNIASEEDRAVCDRPAAVAYARVGCRRFRKSPSG